MSTPRYRSAPPSLSGSAISVSKAMTPSSPGLKSDIGFLSWSSWGVRPSHGRAVPSGHAPSADKRRRMPDRFSYSTALSWVATAAPGVSIITVNTTQSEPEEAAPVPWPGSGARIITYDRCAERARSGNPVRGHDGGRSDDAVRLVDGPGRGPRDSGADRDGARHHVRAGPPPGPYRAAQGARPGGLHLLQQPDLAQGPGPGRAAVGVCRLPLVRARPPGDRRGRRAHDVAGQQRAVLLLQGARVAERSVGQQAVAGHRVPRGA